MIVLDASAAIALLLNHPQHRALAIGNRLSGEEVHAPHLLDVEVAHTLRRFVLAGNLSAQVAATALTGLEQLQITRYPHYPMLQPIWALRMNLTAYDAAYVALADWLGAPLLTLDVRLARSGVSVAIEVF